MWCNSISCCQILIYARDDEEELWLDYHRLCRKNGMACKWTIKLITYPFLQVLNFCIQQLILREMVTRHVLVGGIKCCNIKLFVIDWRSLRTFLVRILPIPFSTLVSRFLRSLRDKAPNASPSTCLNQKVENYYIYGRNWVKLTARR